MCLCLKSVRHGQLGELPGILKLQEAECWWARWSLEIYRTNAAILQGEIWLRSGTYSERLALCVSVLAL